VRTRVWAGHTDFGIAHAHQFAWNRSYPSTSLHTLAEQLLRIGFSEFGHSSSTDGKSSQGKYEQTDGQTVLLNAIRSIFRDRQQYLHQKHLKFLHEEAFRIVYTNKRTDDIAWLVNSEFYWRAGNKHISRSIRLRFRTTKKKTLHGPASIGSSSQFGSV